MVLFGNPVSPVPRFLRVCDIKVEARLVWGSDTAIGSTNGATNGATNCLHKVEDTRLLEALSRTFKWKNYYQITNCTTLIATESTNTVKVSPRCTLKIKNAGAGKVEVELYGDDKFVSKSTWSLSRDEWFTLGGPDKDKSAWFVVLHSNNPKE